MKLNFLFSSFLSYSHLAKARCYGMTQSTYSRHTNREFLKAHLFGFQRTGRIGQNTPRPHRITNTFQSGKSTCSSRVAKSIRSSAIFKRRHKYMKYICSEKQKNRYVLNSHQSFPEIKFDKTNKLVACTSCLGFENVLCRESRLRRRATVGLRKFDMGGWRGRVSEGKSLGRERSVFC